MSMELPSDRPRPVSDHFSELYGIVRVSIILLFLTTIAWAYNSDSLMRLWMDSLPLGAASMDLSVYSPFDWLEIRWSIAILPVSYTHLTLPTKA